MDSRSRCLLVVLTLCTVVAGCRTPLALRRHTVQHGDSVADIHQQQVLDNLAKFMVDPYALPSFALTAAGGAEVSDQCNAGLDLNWISTGFDSAGLSLGGQRNQGTSWVTTPITDPRKLELMRCAYQRVLTRCGCFQSESTSCPDCNKRFNQFYTGRPYAFRTDISSTTCYECENGQLTTLVSPPFDDPCVCSNCKCDNDETLPTPDANDESAANCKDCPSPGNGTVNSECLSCSNGRWFCWSRNKKRIPTRCNYVGHHCGMYVWVPAGPGRDELTKLTLAILDFAVHDDAELPTKQVVAYLGCDLQPTTEGEAHYVISTTLNLNDSSASIHEGDITKRLCKGEEPKSTDPGVRAMRAPQGQPAGIPSATPLQQRRSPMPGAGIPFEQLYLRTLP